MSTLNIQENVSLKSRTTFDIGGTARYFVDVHTEDEIREATKWAKDKNIRFLVIAGGSNLLLPDEGLDALVICIDNSNLSFRSTMLEAEAGCNLLALIRTATTHGLGGWEKLAGIPGTIGGAVRGNAGAFGPEIKDFVVRVRALNSETGEIGEFENVECDFSYRHSFFKKHSEWIVTRALLELEETDPKESAALIERTIAEREKRHIQNVRAAGSFFVNPVVPQEIQEMFEKEKGMKSREGRVPAGWLIEKAGMKGARVGDAVASPQHPNYLMNAGEAKSGDVRKLAQMIQEAVKDKFGVTLEEEAAVF